MSKLATVITLCFLLVSLSGCTTDKDMDSIKSEANLDEDCSNGKLEACKSLCDGGEAAGCFNLGVLYDDGRGVKQDDFKAAKLYEKACDGGIAESCYNFGHLYYKGEGVRESTQRAKEYFDKACDMKLQEGCDAYAELSR
jgi:hypothetical protein